ncbi:E3 ubiquitin-protein ligase Mdm2 isoform X2 [Amia ocellicauda]|nr:MDM2 ligase [Amia calva]
METDNCLSNSQINAADNEKLVKPKGKLQTLLKHAGADKDIFTMKEVMFYLGQYIMDKQLYDKKQQHIVHCSNDLLGDVLGVSSFSVKEPRILYAMFSKNLVAVKNHDSQSGFTEPRSQSEPDRGPEKEESNRTSTATSCSSTSERRRRRSSDHAGASTDEEHCEPRKRHKSDSISLTFDDSLSWCVIGGLRRDRGNSESSDSRSDEIDISGSEDSETSFSQDSDSDHFSVEFEVESIYSDTYSQNDEASELTDEDNEVYEVTVYEADDGDDSFDEDPEISEADYWKCLQCEELNPPLPRHCPRCWSVRPDWFPELESDQKSWPTKSSPDIAAVVDKHSTEEGIDVPDGKRCKSEHPCDPREDSSKDVSGTKILATESQETQYSLPSTSGSSCPASQEEAPELERMSSLEATLPQSSIEPCVICQSRPKNGCIVHGRTGHVMACYTCAKKLKKRNKLCPVCREPIQSVVLTYFS